MKCKAYNGEVRSSEKDFETLQLGAFATPGLVLAQGPVGLTAKSGFNWTSQMSPPAFQVRIAAQGFYCRREDLKRFSKITSNSMSNKV
jgi:hypothetical protein